MWTHSTYAGCVPTHFLNIILNTTNIGLVELHDPRTDKCKNYEHDELHNFQSVFELFYAYDEQFENTFDDMNYKNT